MEDILASIRRIIADDQSQANRPAAAAPRRAPPVPDRPASPPGKAERTADYGELLDLSRAPAVTLDAPQPVRSEPVQTARSAVASDHEFLPEDRSAPLAPASRAAPAAPVTNPTHVNGYAAPTLVRDYEQGGYAAVDAAPAQIDRYPPVQDHAFTSAGADGDDDGLMSPALGTSVMSAFETLAATVVLQNSDMLDRVMRDLMRPLIKTWLDDNLPTLVERLIRAEIERVARGGRG